jgi:hypothetical protein
MRPALAALDGAAAAAGVDPMVHFQFSNSAPDIPGTVGSVKHRAQHAIPPSSRILSLNTIEGTIVALQELAATRGAVFGVDKAASWFDGFWDFFVNERDTLVDGRSWWVSGTYWFAMLWERVGSDSEPELRLDLFVECKDCRPRRVAPSPVASIYVDDGKTVPPDHLPPRPRGESQAALLESLGFTVDVGYWGAHVYKCVETGPTPTELATIVDATLNVMPEANHRRGR